jgi:AraC-like DNA-binding protein
MYTRYKGPTGPSHLDFGQVWQFDDPAAAAACLPAGQFRMIAIGPPPFAANHQARRLGQDVALHRLDLAAPVLLWGSIDGPETLLLLPPETGEPPPLLDGVPMAPDALALRHPGGALTLRSFGGGRWYLLALGKAALQQALAKAAEAPAAEEPATLAALPQDSLATLRALCRQAFATPAGATAELAALRAALLAGLADAAAVGRLLCFRACDQRHNAAMADIDRVLDAIDDHGCGLGELCAATGLSRRTVETLVLARTGMTPTAYLRQRRLALARSALLHPGPSQTVTDVAMEFGFWHLSRFAGAYRATYGETPSRTLEHGLQRSRA